MIDSIDKTFEDGGTISLDYGSLYIRARGADESVALYSKKDFETLSHMAAAALALLSAREG